MTFSILVRDPETGALGGASATGNLCVGGWVLRGDPRGGLSASQGKTPSTLWGEDALDAMRRGVAASKALAAVVDADAGRAGRQLLVLDRNGQGAAFTGADNIPAVSEIVASDCVVGGNMLGTDAVTRACLSGFANSDGPMDVRLLAALEQGAAAGGDMRGLISAAILVVSPDAPPINLRIDHGETPLSDLRHLIERTRSDAYAGWRSTLPTRRHPDR